MNVDGHKMSWRKRKNFIFAVVGDHNIIVEKSKLSISIAKT